MLIDGRLNLNTDTNSVYIGFEAGINIDMTLAKQNTAIGYQSGKSIQSGSRNTYVGYKSGSMNPSSVANTMIGYEAGYRGTSGSNNVFLGSVAGFNNSNSNNVMLGVRAGANNSGQGNIFIGRASGQNESGSHRLYIESAEFNEEDNTNPLIYGEFDNDLIRINGSFHITDFAKLKPRSDAPTSPETGTIFYDSNDNKVKVWTGSAWENLN